MARAPAPPEEIPESDRMPHAPHPRATMFLAGQAEAEATLLNAFRAGTLPHAWILGGPEGIGKATLAWRFARFVMAHPDPAALAVQQAHDCAVDPADPAVRRLLSLSHGDMVLVRRGWNDKTKKHYTEIRVDDVRAMLHVFHRAAGDGGWRIAIIDCVDDLNRSSANALLKMIEEPPPRTLFLLIAHRPGQVLPTIRSRCRMLMLHPLGLDDLRMAVTRIAGALPDPALLDMALGRAGGSVREALRLLDGDGLELTRRLDRIVHHLPGIDWNSIHQLADMVSARDKTREFEVFVAALCDFMHEKVRRGGEKGLPPHRLAPLADVWDKIAQLIRETEALNLDRRPLVLAIFPPLAAALAQVNG